jgi:hypothetical protein
LAGFSWQGFLGLSDEVIFVASDISIHIFLLNKDWTFDVCKDERVAVVIFYIEIKIAPTRLKKLVGVICMISSIKEKR